MKITIRVWFWLDRSGSEYLRTVKRWTVITKKLCEYRVRGAGFLEVRLCECKNSKSG